MLWAGLTWMGLALISYLLGGISTAYLVTRIATGQDIRKLGNRNAGANNVYRAVGARAGITVGIFDIAKGSLAILLARTVVDSTTAEMMAGIAVVAGRIIGRCIWDCAAGRVGPPRWVYCWRWCP